MDSSDKLLLAQQRVELFDRERRLSEDLALAKEASDLRETYGGHWREHPEYPISQWMAEIASFDTRLGYWEWIANAERGKEVEQGNG